MILMWTTIKTNIQEGHITNYLGLITAIISLVGYVIAVKNPDNVQAKFIIDNATAMGGVIVTIITGLFSLGKK